MNRKPRSKAGRIRANDNEETAEQSLSRLMAPLWQAGGIYADAAQAVESCFALEERLQRMGDCVMRMACALSKQANRVAKERSRMMRARSSRK